MSTTTVVIIMIADFLEVAQNFFAKFIVFLAIFLALRWVTSGPIFR